MIYFCLVFAYYGNWNPGYVELINIIEVNLYLKIIVKYIATKRSGTKKLTSDKLDILNIKIFRINGKYWFSVIFF